MKTYLKTISAAVGLFTFSLLGSAFADGDAGKAASAPVTKAEPAATKSDAAAKTAPAAAGETREQLLEELKKANAQLAEDKKAAAAAKGDAVKAAKEKVKADGKLINEINMKLHKLKVEKKAEGKPGAKPEGKPAAKPEGKPEAKPVMMPAT